MGFYNLINQNIVNLLNLDLLKDEDRNRIINRMSDLVQKRVVVKIIEFLKEDEIDNLVKLLSDNTDEEVMKYLDDNVPHLEELVLEEVNKLKVESQKYLTV